MKDPKTLKTEGQAIAKRLGVNKLFATADGQFFKQESYAELHSRNNGGVKVHELTYGSGATKAAPKGSKDNKGAAASAKKSTKKEGATDPNTDAGTEGDPASTASKPEDLTAVKGVGEATAKKLADAGITTIAALAGANAEELAEKTGLNAELMATVVAEAANVK